LNAREVVEGYEAVLATSLRMRDAARRSEWENLVVLDEQRFALLRNLLAEDGGDLGLDELNQKKISLIHAILDCDVETGALTKVWMAELRQILDSIGTEKKLGDAYASSE